MTGWAELERAVPDLAAAGRRLLVGADGVAIGFLATVGARGSPHLAPVCPIFCGSELSLSAGAHTPKAADLRAHRAYVLYAVLGASDEEFQVAGRASEGTDSAERAAVHAAIPFVAFSRADPLFRSSIARAWGPLGARRPARHPRRPLALACALGRGLRQRQAATCT